MLIALIVVAAVLVVLAIVAPLVDRVVAVQAERKASEYLSAPFGHPATVRVHTRPFLTQALRGRYSDVEVRGGLRIGDISGAILIARLTNAYLPLRELLGRRATELPCERVQGRLLVPYPELSRVARIPGLSLAFDGDRLLATAALPVPALSQVARVTGEAVISLTGSGGAWLSMRGVSMAGISLPNGVLRQLLPTLSVPIPLPALPYGLRFDELRPTEDGLAVDGSAEAVVFHRRPVAAA
ncbi:MAG TPA: DUF2993 domain-containing protein [Jatrophihabitans sp.]|jgi:hypothetical protein|nr:DUF2993 domain-containing protein [Jatrophihabitans sp.]